ncbi:MAG: D-alanine--D-alanine ligase [Candidatus Omnitrophota bacterium]|nr:D-alanine--D-alanine ligase [Candidatus Omnitrophota bacterium]
MNEIRGKRVGVLAGGPSNEREISLKSGRAVYSALIQGGVDTIFLDVYEDVHDIIKNNSIDIVFIALHGRFGEDGTVQKILEDRGIPYTGSGPEASRLALDKIASKDVFTNKGIPVPRYIVFEKDNFDIRDAQFTGLPLVVKPHLEGSSIGLSVVRDKSDLMRAINKAFRYGTKIILEEYIDGRELTVGILDDEPLPVIEIVPKERVYDYKAKYSDPDTKYLVPAPIGDELSEKAKRLGKLAHISLGCRSFSRADMMMDGSGNIFVLEVNTIPGMTERSLLPKAAEACGLSFGTLCVKLIEYALKGISK